MNIDGSESEKYGATGRCPNDGCPFQESSNIQHSSGLQAESGRRSVDSGGIDGRSLKRERAAS